jgi:hypothetical protein
MITLILRPKRFFGENQFSSPSSFLGIDSVCHRCWVKPFRSGFLSVSSLPCPVPGRPYRPRSIVNRQFLTFNLRAAAQPSTGGIRSSEKLIQITNRNKSSYPHICPFSANTPIYTAPGHGRGPIESLLLRFVPKQIIRPFPVSRPLSIFRGRRQPSIFNFQHFSPCLF